MFTPSEAALEQLTSSEDIATMIVNGAAEKKKLVTADLLIKDAQVSLKLVGSLVTNAIMVDEKYGTHSIGFAFDDNADLVSFLEMYKFFDNLNLGADWKVVDMIRNKRIYLKLKIKNNQYVPRTNIKWSPKNAADAPLVRYQKVEVQVDLKSYFSLEDPKSCGFYFDIYNILFDTSK